MPTTSRFLVIFPDQERIARLEEIVPLDSLKGCFRKRQGWNRYFTELLNIPMDYSSGIKDSRWAKDKVPNPIDHRPTRDKLITSCEMLLSAINRTGAGIDKFRGQSPVRRRWTGDQVEVSPMDTDENMIDLFFQIRNFIAKGSTVPAIDVDPSIVRKAETGPRRVVHPINKGKTDTATIEKERPFGFLYGTPGASYFDSIFLKKLPSLGKATLPRIEEMVIRQCHRVKFHREDTTRGRFRSTESITRFMIVVFFHVTSDRALPVPHSIITRRERRLYLAEISTNSAKYPRHTVKPVKADVTEQLNPSGIHSLGLSLDKVFPLLPTLPIGFCQVY